MHYKIMYIWLITLTKSEKENGIVSSILKLDKNIN